MTDYEKYQELNDQLDSGQLIEIDYNLIRSLKRNGMCIEANELLRKYHEIAQKNKKEIKSELKRIENKKKNFLIKIVPELREIRNEYARTWKAKLKLQRPLAYKNKYGGSVSKEKDSCEKKENES